MSFTNNSDVPQLSPQIILRKGPVEIKVQNAAAVIKRINEIVPGSTYENCKRNRIVDERDRWQSTAKDWFKKEMFGGSEEDFEVIVSEQTDSSWPDSAPNPFNNFSEPQVVQSVNKNAYELREMILERAICVVRETNKNISTDTFVDKVLEVSDKFYSFVENRRKNR